jgi:hypothetical protein
VAGRADGIPFTGPPAMKVVGVQRSPCGELDARSWSVTFQMGLPYPRGSDQEAGRLVVAVGEVARLA